jgi:hypothetical protein
MGRELKRVPIDFNWPLEKTWGGYLNPFYGQATKCPDCDGSGYSVEAKRLKDMWYGYVPFRPEDRGSAPLKTTDPAVRRFAERNVTNAPDYYGKGEEAIEREARRLCDMWNQQWCHHLNENDVAALVAAGRLMDLTHTWTPENKWQPKDPPHVPTAKEVNEWSLAGFGHDSSNQWIVTGEECKRLGYESHCPRCDGEGDLWPSDEIKQQYEDWQQTEPPTGEGYQLWETTSEGSPVSPVFASLPELCDWCADNATTFGNSKASSEEWRGMLDADFVCHREGNHIFM